MEIQIIKVLLYFYLWCDCEGQECIHHICHHLVKHLRCSINNDLHSYCILITICIAAIKSLFFYTDLLSIKL